MVIPIKRRTVTVTLGENPDADSSDSKDTSSKDDAQAEDSQDDSQDQEDQSTDSLLQDFENQHGGWNCLRTVLWIP